MLLSMRDPLHDWAWDEHDSDNLCQVYTQMSGREASSIDGQCLVMADENALGLLNPQPESSVPMVCIVTLGASTEA